MKEKRMDINRENAMRLWKQRYGKATRVKDFAGREMDKGAYDQRGSEFGWNLDHILPKSRGGKDTDSNLICTHILTNDEKADKYPVFTANKKQFEIIKVENHYEIREKPTVKKPASVQNQDVAKSSTTNSESNDTANQSGEDRGINFFDTTAGIKCYESYKKDFWGSVTIEIERPQNAAIVDFIKELFGENFVSVEYEDHYYSNYKMTVRVSGIRLTTKATIQEQLDDCMLLNSYLKYYFLRKKIIGGYTIFCEAHTQADELKCYKAQNKHNGQSYYVKDRLLINELVRINTNAEKNRNESQKISTDSVGYYVYEYDYYWTKVKENLEKK